MRLLSRSTLVPSAAALLVVAGVVAQPATATGGMFGLGTPGFVVSQAGSNIVLHDFAGEPSIGIDWRTGSGLFIASSDVARLTFNNTTGNATWTDASPAKGLSQNLDPILTTEPHSGVTLAGGDTGACSAMWASTDDGVSWTPSVPCTGTFDHPTVGYAPSATTPGTTVFYYCQQGPVLQHCETSTTNGTAWTPGGVAASGSSPIPLLECTGLHGHIRGSADGTAYLPGKNCFNSSGSINVGGVETSNDGLTWSQYLIPGSSNSGFDPAVATTPDNTLYEAWQAGASYHPLIARSKDHGGTWTTPVDLASTVSPPLVASTFPTLVAGDNGRIAYSFLGSSVGSGNPNTTGFHGIWYVYTSFSYDGGVTWATVKDTPNPVQYGEIDNGGTTTTGQRNLLDFIDSSMTKDGRVVVAYADGCLSDCQAAAGQAAAEKLSTHATASVAYQLSGVGLLSAYDVAAPVLSATVGKTQIELSWSAPSGETGITGYEIYRGTAAGSEVLIQTISSGTTYFDGNLTPHTTYYYRVAAVTSAGRGPLSNEVSASTK